jgi:predicted small integral membrane protein
LAKGIQIVLRLIKILLVVLVGLWGLIAGAGNLFGYAGGHAQVVSVMSREGALAAGGPFVAISHPLLTHLGYAVVWSGKLLSAVFCLWGAALLWRSRAASTDDFNAAKTMSLAGCGVALIMLFGGFFVAGGAYFSMWSSDVGASSHAFATQYIVGIGIIALFVANRND